MRPVFRDLASKTVPPGPRFFCRAGQNGTGLHKHISGFEAPRTLAPKSSSARELNRQLACRTTRIHYARSLPYDTQQSGLAISTLLVRMASEAVRNTTYPPEMSSGARARKGEIEQSSDCLPIPSLPAAGKSSSPHDLTSVLKSLYKTSYLAVLAVWV